MLHSCDYTGGAWFRSTNEEEEHIFYDPGTKQIYKNFGAVSGRKITSIANSKRGFYITSTYSVTGNDLNVGYAYPSDFWNQQSSGKLTDYGAMSKFLRLDIDSSTQKIYFLAIRKYFTSSVNTVRSDFNGMIWSSRYSAYVNSKKNMDKAISVLTTSCDKTQQIISVELDTDPLNISVKEFLRLESIDNLIAVQVW